jgi:hypothetical protein
MLETGLEAYDQLVSRKRNEIKTIINKILKNDGNKTAKVVLATLRHVLNNEGINQYNNVLRGLVSANHEEIAQTLKIIQPYEVKGDIIAILDS